jgi:hypothetical protein
VDQDKDGYSADEDCNDNDPNIHPGAPELCDDVDSDCDGEVADAHSIDAAVYHPDMDNDGRGDSTVQVTSCTPPEGYVVDATDCDDTTPRVSPDVAEICDGLDNDCDGQIDEADARNAPTWHLDLDEDGFGDPETPGTTGCEGPADHANNGDDCDDDDPAVHPDAEEIWYDGVDQDCDGWSDFDQDRDGYDDLNHGGLDCDDTDGAVHPAAEEICNDGIDNDCDTTANACGMHGVLSIGSARTQITGEGARDQIGNAIAPAGDVDGDGQADLLIDARFSDLGGANAGAVYLLRGPIPEGEIGLESAATVVTGEAEEDQLGSAILGAIDLNGDGIPDMVLTSVNSAASGLISGTAYIILGPVEGVLSVADADARIVGTSLGMQLGYAVEAISDQDGDGLPDLALGAPLFGGSAGLVAIVSGAVTGSVDLDEVTLSSMTGATAFDSLGASIGAVDWDGDGITELLIGAPDYTSLEGIQPGAVFGAAVPLPSAPEDADWSVTGPEDQSRFGHTIMVAGDLDGDGLTDVIIGASGTDEAGTNAGAAYLFLGPLTGNITASEADTVFLGAAEEDRLGNVMTSAGDIDGDGIPDLAMGAPTHSPDSTLTSQAGLIMIFSGDLRGVIEGATDAEAWIEGEAAGDEAGSSLTTLGDTDGDGINDLLIGSPYQDTAGANAGTVFVLTGGGI